VHLFGQILLSLKPAQLLNSLLLTLPYNGERFDALAAWSFNVRQHRHSGRLFFLFIFFFLAFSFFFFCTVLLRELIFIQHILSFNFLGFLLSLLLFLEISVFTATKRLSDR
jgi:hypothetical protein